MVASEDSPAVDTLFRNKKLGDFSLVALEVEMVLSGFSESSSTTKVDSVADTADTSVVLITLVTSVVLPGLFLS